MTVSTRCSGSGRHCHHPLKRRLPLIIVGGFRSSSSGSGGAPPSKVEAKTSLGGPVGPSKSRC
eukprot:COSAG01_NODE_38688_length_486_cov_1.459948_1_plen_62_part_01